MSGGSLAGSTDANIYS